MLKFITKRAKMHYQGKILRNERQVFSYINFIDWEGSEVISQSDLDKIEQDLRMRDILTLNELNICIRTKISKYNPSLIGNLESLAWAMTTMAISFCTVALTFPNNFTGFATSSICLFFVLMINISLYVVPSKLHVYARYNLFLEIFLEKVCDEIEKRHVSNNKNNRAGFLSQFFKRFL